MCQLLKINQLTKLIKTLNVMKAALHGGKLYANRVFSVFRIIHFTKQHENLVTK